MLFVFNGFCRLVFRLPKRRFCLETKIGPECQYCNDLHDDKRECSRVDQFSYSYESRFSLEFSGLLRRSVFSRHKRTNPLGPSASSVVKNCPLSTVFKPALEHSLDNFWSSGSCSNCCSYSCNKFHRRCSSVPGSAKEVR